MSQVPRVTVSRNKDNISLHTVDQNRILLTSELWNGIPYKLGYDHRGQYDSA